MVTPHLQLCNPWPPEVSRSTHSCFFLFFQSHSTLSFPAESLKIKEKHEEINDRMETSVTVSVHKKSLS
jgi:hypothetical protein